MIKLREKPTNCESCPFACTVEGYVRENGEIKSKTSIRCGARRENADINNCPIGQI